MHDDTARVNKPREKGQIGAAINNTTYKDGKPGAHRYEKGKEVQGMTTSPAQTGASTATRGTARASCQLPSSSMLPYTKTERPGRSV